MGYYAIVYRESSDEKSLHAGALSRFADNAQGPLLMCPSQVPEGSTRGWIVPIGGGEEKENNPQILQRFVELCGGRDGV